jgi:hypothetical protein
MVLCKSQKKRRSTLKKVRYIRREKIVAILPGHAKINIIEKRLHP